MMTAPSATGFQGLGVIQYSLGCGRLARG